MIDGVFLKGKLDLRRALREKEEKHRIMEDIDS